MQKHIVIFSHGFGVDKTDLGLFTSISGGLPEVESVLFDYNTVDEQVKTIIVKPFSEQAEILREVVDKTRTSNPNAVIDIVAHSQGCNVVSILKPIGIRRIILICPPANLGFESTLRRARSKPGTIIDLGGTSVLVRSDGTKRFVPASYWNERSKINPIAEYEKLAAATDTTIIVANQDDVIGPTEFPGFNVVKTDGGHDFKDPKDRALLIAKIREIIL